MTTLTKVIQERNSCTSNLLVTLSFYSIIRKGLFKVYINKADNFHLRITGEATQRWPYSIPTPPHLQIFWVRAPSQSCITIHFASWCENYLLLSRICQLILPPSVVAFLKKNQWVFEEGEEYWIVTWIPGSFHRSLMAATKGGSKEVTVS